MITKRCGKPSRNQQLVNAPQKESATDHQGQVASFTGLSGASSYCLNAVTLVSAEEGWAVGSDGLIVHELHGVWTRTASPTNQTLNSLTMLSPTEDWAVGEQGTILHYLQGSWSIYWD